MGKKILLLSLCIICVATIWVSPVSFCRNIACIKKYNAWFRVRYDPNIALFITPQNSDFLFNRIDNSAQREAAKEMIAMLATKHVQQKPVSPISCAVVGNSGNLLHSNYGQQIDAHTYVFRMNNAPVQGYEKDVGTRTTHHVAHSNTPSIRDYGVLTATYMIIDDFGINYRDENQESELRSDIIDRVMYLTALQNPALNLPHQIRQKNFSPEDMFPGLHRLLKLPESQVRATNFPGNVTKLKGNFFFFHPAFLFYIGNKWFQPENKQLRDVPSTGFKTIIFALHLCDEVDIFGFGANKETKRWDHYYNQGLPLNSTPKMHRAEYQEEFFEHLVSERVVRIYR